MKFVICDDTHFFKLDDFKEEYEKFLTNIHHEIISYDDLPDEWKKSEYSRLHDCFDYHTDKGCVVDIDLNDLQKLSDDINPDDDSNNYFFIDMKNHIIVITPYYPDN